VSGDWEVNVLQSNDGFSLFVELGGGVDPVGPDLNVFVQKSRLGATSLLTGASEKGSESELNNALAMLGVSVLGEEGLEFLEKVFGWVTDIVGQRSNDAADDQGVVSVLNDVTDDKGGWASSGNNKSIQEEFVFGKISSLKFLLNLFQVSVVKSTDEWDDREGADLVELLKIMENFDVFQRFVNLVDVLLELFSSLVLSSGIKIGIVMMEEEGLGALEVFILIVFVFEDEFNVVGFSTIGWASNRSGFDFLEGSGDHSKTVLGVSLSSEKSVHDARSDDNPVDSQATILDLQVIDTKTGGVKGIPGVVVRAVRSGNARGSDAFWVVLALVVVSVFADLSVVLILARNNNVFSDTFTDYSFFFGLGDGSVSQVNVRKVELEGRGETPLHVLGPDWDVLVEDDSLDHATFNLDGKRFGQRSQLSEGLPVVVVTLVVVILSVVQAKFDIVQLDVQHTGTSLDVELSSEIDGGCKANVVLRTGDQGSRVAVNVFLSGLEEGCANISLNKSGAAEHKAQKNKVLHD